VVHTCNYFLQLFYHFFQLLKNAIILTYEGEILGITLPAKVTLKVVESAPAVRGDTSENALKDAVLETGLQTKVQLFIEEGDEIIVSTEDGSYVSRA
jgi:elongation factor P